MNRQKMQSYQMLTRVVNLGNQTVGLFPKQSAAAGVLEAMESNVKRMSEEATTALSAETAIRVFASEKSKARQVLKRYLARASQTCQALHSDNTPLPAKKDDQSLINSARVFVTDAEAMKDQFSQYGLTLEEIQTAVRNLEQALLNHTTAKAKRSAAIQKWNVALAEALDHLRRLDALVANILEGQPGPLASYAIARTIPRTGGGRKTAETAVAAAPAA